MIKFLKINNIVKFKQMKKLLIILGIALLAGHCFGQQTLNQANNNQIISEKMDTLKKLNIDEYGRNKRA